MDFEYLAVNHIRTLCSRTENLASDIPVGDKGISFDGKITLYDSNGRTIRGYKYDIPVQVKSLQVESFSGEGIKYDRLSRNHYINYISRGGCLLFVVEIDKKTGESKAYFKCLLPINTREMLNKNPANNMTINLQRLSSKEHLVKICEFMHRHMKLQHNDNDYVSVDSKYLNDVKLTPISPNIDKVKKHHNFFETRYFAYGTIGHIILPVEGLFHLDQIEFYEESLIFTVGDYNFSLACIYSRKKIVGI